MLGNPPAPLLEYEKSPNYLLPLELCGRGMTGHDDRMAMPKRRKIIQRKGGKELKVLNE
jgi:hypothetical protein